MQVLFLKLSNFDFYLMNGIRKATYRLSVNEDVNCSVEKSDLEDI